MGYQDVPAQSTSPDLNMFTYITFLQAGASALNDSEVMTLVDHGDLPNHQLEKAVGKPERGVCIRRKILGRIANLNFALTHLPFRRYDYSKVSHVIVAVGQVAGCRGGRVWIIVTDKSSGVANVCRETLC